MLKRNIAILIAGGLLSAQSGLAVAQSGSLPESPAWKPLPAQEQYFAERAARDPNPTGAKGPVFPAANTGGQSARVPALDKYLADRAARDSGTMLATSVFFDGHIEHCKYSPN